MSSPIRRSLSVCRLSLGDTGPTRYESITGQTKSPVVLIFSLGYEIVTALCRTGDLWWPGR